MVRHKLLLSQIWLNMLNSVQGYMAQERRLGMLILLNKEILSKFSFNLIETKVLASTLMDV